MSSPSTPIPIPAGLTLKGNPTSSRGRTLVASENFGPGNLIAVFNDDLGSNAQTLAIPESPHLSQTCSGCLATPASSAGPPDVKDPVLLPGPDNDTAKPKPFTLKACTACRSVYYCSQACQRADWNLVHKAECKVFRRVKTGGHDFLPTPVRGLVQVLLRPGLEAAVRELEGHEEEFRRTGEGDAGGDEGGGFWGDAQLQARAALHYLGREANPRSLGEAVSILCKLKVNSFNCSDPDIGQTGSFMNPGLAMVNHSCNPNAFVTFLGRRGLVYAYRDIKKGEEIEISYIGMDCTSPRSHRHQDLKLRYHFTCTCPRCKDDLDVYQMASQYPHLSLNTLSLAPDLQQEFISDPSPRPVADSSLAATVEEIYPWCAKPLSRNLTRTETAKALRHKWRACKPLIAAKDYAIEPLSLVLAQAVGYFNEEGHEDAPTCLAIWCFKAIYLEPYKEPAPFGVARVKTLLLIAKMIANLAAPTSIEYDSIGRRIAAGRTGPRSRAAEKAKVNDPTTICQLLAELTLHYAPEDASAANGVENEWWLYREARWLLADIESLPARETESALVKAFKRNPRGSEERRFFDQVVLNPVKELADLALEIMESEFGS
ncbi:SET domain-containing protein [Xylariaceae sp. FL0255]|nr:SET domain-containing protein [Xylariaceae sp. FL0255]